MRDDGVAHLRIGTLNIWQRLGPWEARLALIRAELERLELDAICLQEVLSFQADDALESQAHVIAEGLFEHGAVGSSRDLGGGLHFGNAILSRWPLEDIDTVALFGSSASDQERSMTSARMHTPHGVMPIISTHLNWKLDEGFVRYKQAEELLAEVRRLERKEDLPVVLCGDMNAPPDADEIRLLTGKTGASGKSPYLCDAWVWGGEGPGYTFDPRRNAFATQARCPRARLDYVLASWRPNDKRGKIERAELAFTDELDGVCPSDHFGVVATLRV